MHWTSEFYERLDRGDRTVGNMLASDIAVQIGNHAETRGIDAMMAGELGRHAAIAPTCIHVFKNIWDLDENTAALDSVVTYNRIDRRDVTIPVLTVMHRDGKQLIDGLRLFLDNSPLFKDIEA